MDPGHYLTSSYYEHWLTGVSTLHRRGRADVARRARPSSRWPVPAVASRPRRPCPRHRSRDRTDAAVRGRRSRPCPRVASQPVTRARRGTCRASAAWSCGSTVRYNVPDVEAHSGGSRARADLLGALHGTRAVGRRWRRRRRRPRRPVGALPRGGSRERRHDHDHHRTSRSPRRGAGRRDRVGARRAGHVRHRAARRDRRQLRAQPRSAERRQGGRPGVGRSRTTRRGCSPTARRRSPSSASVAPKATTWWSSRTRRTCTTSSSARCARATRGRRSACRRRGTRRRRTGRVRCVSREPSSPRWAPCCPTTSSIRVWDSSAEVRYLVLPERPAGTDDADRGGARGARDPRLDDRRATAVNTELPDDVALMGGATRSHATTGSSRSPHRGRDGRWRSRSRSSSSSICRGTSSVNA